MKCIDLSLRLGYSALGCQCRLNKGGTLFRRTRYQQGSLVLEERKRGSAVWVYRWWEKDINGKPVRRKLQIGNLEQYPTESVAQAAADALRLTINNPSNRRNLRQTTVNILWEHYCREELPLKEMSTQDAYSVYAKNWILPRWGTVLLEEIKTVEVECWLRAAEVADGTRAKVKCVLSAMFSHAVRWEFCGHNEISSGIPVGSGGKRGPSTGVRVSAKRQEAPLFLSPEQVKLGLTKLGFRDQLLVFLDGALGTRRGELGALRWSDCNFDSMSFSVQHSYYWRRGGHLKATKTEASAKALPMHLALKDALLEWKSQSDYNPRLLASLQSPCDEQVSSSNAAEQTSGTGETRGCYLAWRFVVGEQSNSHSIVGAEERVPGFVRGNAQRAECFEGLLDPNGP